MDDKRERTIVITETITRTIEVREDLPSLIPLRRRPLRPAPKMVRYGMTFRQRIAARRERLAGLHVY